MYADLDKRNKRRRERYHERIQDVRYTCQCCGIEYHPKDKRRDKYCTRECSDKQKAIDKIAKVEHKEELKNINFCIHCGLVHGTSRTSYCSDKCRIEAGRIKSRDYQRAIRGLDYKTVECKCCGKQFMQTIDKSKVYCSEECAKTYANAEYRHTRKRRIKQNGRADQGINLRRLIRKDNNLCHICGMPCDDSAFHITTEGHFITGDNYPSVDHVIPLSKGGTHTHNNVKLAHFKCNRDKSDSI